MKVILASLILICFNLQAQEYYQTVKGRVRDGQTTISLKGAKVEILDSIHSIPFVLTDENGYFQIDSVPTGRISIRVTYQSYLEYLVSNLNHESGKETYLEVELYERFTELKAGKVKGKSTTLNNNNITLSARAFNIDDTKRFAGSRNDPARMASNFAGVVGNNDSRNDIIIRGNSPQGLLWRLEGLDIPNPSHFGAMGASGGPVTILNNNVLAKSDFLTGAFPSMYGNASAGVFDLQMREGNKDKYEFTGQIGFNGFEAGAEGPIKRSKKSSFLINYRYSTLAVLQKIGLNFGTGTAIPYYQDLSFKLNFPMGKHNLSFFGIGGFSNIHFENSGQTDSSNFYSTGNQDLKYKTTMGVTGVSYTHVLNPRMYIKSSLGFTYTGVKTLVDSVSNDNVIRISQYRDNSSANNIVLNSLFNYKINAAKQFNLGINIQNPGFKFHDSARFGNSFKPLRNINGNTFLLQAFANMKYKLSPYTTLNTGLHYQGLKLNGSGAIEPRIGINHQLGNFDKISLATGFHSQMQNMQTYYLLTETNNNFNYTNKNLGMNKSIHFVAAYEKNISRTWRFKTEAYYQYLYNIAVTQSPSYYSTINEGTDFNRPNTDSLVNEGTGFNYGLEFTLEKTFSKGFYMLNTISLYQSKYKGSNGELKNTAFNGNYVGNVLAGKEIKLNSRNTLSFDTKIAVAGGRRFTPIDLNRSITENKQVLYLEQSFDKSFKPYFRIDFKVTYKLSGKKMTQEWFIDIQNISNRQNIFLESYDPLRKTIVTQYQLGLFPNFNYRINF